MAEVAKGACPNCKELCSIEEYKEYKENGKIIMAPPDIKCQCGVVLRATVPFFKVSESGYELRIKNPSDSERT